MKFIKSNWKGYEIDSSEFFAEIQTENPSITIKSYLNSPYIDSKFNCFNLVSRLISTYKIAESEDADLVNSLKNDVLTIGRKIVVAV